MINRGHGWRCSGWETAMGCYACKVGHFNEKNRHRGVRPQCKLPAWDTILNGTTWHSSLYPTFFPVNCFYFFHCLPVFPTPIPMVPNFQLNEYMLHYNTFNLVQIRYMPEYIMTFTIGILLLSKWSDPKKGSRLT